MQLDVYTHKRRAAVLQLKLASRQEDLGHLQVIGALTARGLPRRMQLHMWKR